MPLFRNSLPAAGGTVSGDLDVTGTLTVTPGATIEIGADTNLYRTGANALATDDGLSVGGALSSFGTLKMDPAGTMTVGGGVAVIGIGNATTVPTTNPVGGVVMYAEGGALKVRGTGGTVTTVAPA